MEQAEVDSAIFELLAEHGPLSFEDLLHMLPTCTWNQVFASVDRLSREAKLSLRHPDRFTYLVSLGPDREKKISTTAL